jgi:predicted Holliday junction resolvase-like endonuclease
MTKVQRAEQTIESLVRARFYAECPCCGETILLRDAGLFYLDNFTSVASETYKGLLDELRERRKEILEARKNIPRVSMTTTTAVNIGFIIERIAPMLDDFKFDHNDCRGLFDPIDYVVFEGLRINGKVSRIIFLDIKTGSARLSGKQNKRT